MPTSIRHEGIIALVRGRLGFAADLLREIARVEVPSFTEARLAEASLNEIVPTDYRADAGPRHRRRLCRRWEPRQGRKILVVPDAFVGTRAHKVNFSAETAIPQGAGGPAIDRFGRAPSETHRRSFVTDHPGVRSGAVCPERVLRRRSCISRGWRLPGERRNARLVTATFVALVGFDLAARHRPQSRRTEDSARV